MKKKFTKQDVRTSILIMIESDGSHHVRLPENENIEFERKAYNNLMNTLMVMDSPSFVLLGALYLERGMRWLSSLVFPRQA